MRCIALGSGSLIDGAASELWLCFCRRARLRVRGRRSRLHQPFLARACLGRRVGAVATGRVMGRRRQTTALPTVAHLLLALRHPASASNPQESQMARRCRPVCRPRRPFLARACLGRRVGAVATGRVMGRRRQRTAMPTVAHLLLALRHPASASNPPESPMAFLWVRLIPAWSRQALRPASGRKYLRSHFHLASARQIRRAEECRSRI